MKNINFCIFALFYIFCPLVSHSEPSKIEPSCLEARNKLWHNCFGKFIFPNGNKYEGFWRDGKPDGVGSASTNSGVTYVGTFKGGKRHGLGEEVNKDGSIYVGNFKNDKKHGAGKIVFLDGRILEENFEKIN